MILAKTANESTFFSVFYHHLKFWTLNFNASQLLQKMFAPHSFLFNNVYHHIYYHPLKFVSLVAKHPVYVCITIVHIHKLSIYDQFPFSNRYKKKTVTRTMFQICLKYILNTTLNTKFFFFLDNNLTFIYFNIWYNSFLIILVFSFFFFFFFFLVQNNDCAIQYNVL